MARNDGADRTCARNKPVTNKEISKAYEHNERQKDVYSNEDIIPERSYLNIHFKKPNGNYEDIFEQMESSGLISTRGLKDDAVKMCELVFDVNTAYFHNNGGYEYAKSFYEESYQSAIKIIGGEQYILSAVMHADEINRAMSEALGEDVYHYHLHVVYVPVVEKEILWSKRCKEKSLIGTVKETIMQVSRSKKWSSKPALDDQGNPLLRKNGKPILKKSYSILQDDFYNHMHSAGYTNVERGERGSTEEHLSVTQFKVFQEKQQLETVKVELKQATDELKETTAKTSATEKELSSLQRQTKEAKVESVTIEDIKCIGKKGITGNITMTSKECERLKNLAINGVIAKGEIHLLQDKLTKSEKSAEI